MTTTKIAIATTDTAWVTRHGGTHDGRYAQVPFPASQVETITFCGQPHLRVALADWPKDATARGSHLMSPAVLSA